MKFVYENKTHGGSSPQPTITLTKYLCQQGDGYILTRTQHPDVFRVLLYSSKR